MDAAQVDLAAMANITNALVALINESNGLKQENAQLWARVKELTPPVETIAPAEPAQEGN